MAITRVHLRVCIRSVSLSATNPFPREDENTPLLGQHPCNLERNTLQNTKEELADILNWVERHTKCMPGYCRVKRKERGQEEAHYLVIKIIPCIFLHK